MLFCCKRAGRPHSGVLLRASRKFSLNIEIKAVKYLLQVLPLFFFFSWTTNIAQLLAHIIVTTKIKAERRARSCIWIAHSVAHSVTLGQIELRVAFKSFFNQCKICWSSVFHCLLWTLSLICISEAFNVLCGYIVEIWHWLFTERGCCFGFQPWSYFGSIKNRLEVPLTGSEWHKMLSIVSAITISLQPSAFERSTLNIYGCRRNQRPA